MDDANPVIKILVTRNTKILEDKTTIHDKLKYTNNKY